VDRSTKLDKLGQRTSDTAVIFFDQVRVPQTNLIGEEGRGFVYQMAQFQEERLFLSSSILTSMRNCIRETVAYISQRKAFGQFLIDNQYIQYRLAELKTEVEACRAMVRRATDDLVAGRDVTLMASMAKLKTARVAREVTDGCLQFWGGQGFMWDNPVARLYRDLRLYSIGGGADEVMLRIISRSLGFKSGTK
jgi:citronellyl-CoA dehydrogenase